MRVLENHQRALIKKKAMFFYGRAKDRYFKENIKRTGVLLLHLSHAVEDFFATLSSPITSNKDFVTDGTIPVKNDMEKTYENIVGDLDITFAEQNAIETNIISSFNYNQLQKNAILIELKRLEGLIDSAEQSISVDFTVAIKFFDNFSSTELVNLITNPGSSEAIAFVDTDAGILTLAKRQESNVWGEGDNIDEYSFLSGALKKLLGVPFNLGRTIGGLPHPVADRDIYTGKMYGTTDIGVVSVEDGIRIDLDTIDERVNGLYKTILRDNGNNMALGSIWEREFTLVDWEDNSTFTDLDGSSVMNVDDIVVDSSVQDAHDSLNIRVKRIPFTKNELPGGYKNSTRNVGNRSPSYIKQIPDHLRFIWGQIPSNVENAELNLVLVIKFKVAKRVGTIRVEPHLFAKNVAPDLVRMRVFDVEARNDDGSTGAWIDIKKSARLGGAISDDAIDTVPKTTSFLAGNRFVNTILISLRQRRSYRQKYDLMAFFGDLQQFDEQGRLISETKKVQYLVDFMGDPLMNILEAKAKLFAFGTLKALGDRNPIDLANFLDRVARVSTSSAMSDPEVKTSGQKMLNISLANEGFLTKFSTSDYISDDARPGRQLKSSQDSGIGPQSKNPNDVISDTIDATFDFFNPKGAVAARSPILTVTVPSDKSNRHRYAIGIRDIAISNVEYAQSSEILTVPFLSPVPIGSIILRTEELIPEEFGVIFPADIRTKPWITYEISFNGGREFHPIAPVGNKPYFVTGPQNKSFQIPTFIQINSDIPDERRDIYPWGPLGFIDMDTSPRTILMNIKLERPPDTAGSFVTGLTPRLDAYEMIVNPGPIGGKP